MLKRVVFLPILALVLLAPLTALAGSVYAPLILKAGVASPTATVTFTPPFTPMATPTPSDQAFVSSSSMATP